VTHRRLVLMVLVALCGLALGWLLAGLLVWIRPAQGAPAVAQDETEPLGPALASGVRCGRARWQQKTLTDPAAQTVNLSPLDSTVEDLIALPAPKSWTPDLPRQVTEFRAYRVPAVLVAFKLEPDSDIHLVLRGTSGATMIAEIPDPRCAHGSVVLPQLAQVRKAFLQRFGAPERFRWRRPLHGAVVVVTGILLFDDAHGQRGVAPNGVELHPVIGLN